ncbi:hypothetical protein [Streptomyces sp. C36]
MIKRSTRATEHAWAALAVAFDGGPRDWGRPPGPLGADAPAWKR